MYSTIKHRVTGEVLKVRTKDLNYWLWRGYKCIDWGYY